MRPALLVMQAFGAYAGRVEIDLERLGPDALFLVHGPTGAGKTTLLDAITWALFGRGTVKDRAVVRSDHAMEDVATEVTLVFVQSGQRYRVWRRAAHERSKKRGTGTTTEPGRAELHRLNAAGAEAGAPLAVGAENVTAAAKDLLGLEADQFCQVAILPQGQFRQLLAADSTDREKILRVLFRTDRLERLQAFLKERAAELRRSVEDRIRQRSQLLADAELADEPALDAEIAACAAATAAVAERLASDRARAAAAAAALRTGEDAAAKVAELEAARAADEEARAATPELDARRIELLAARRAEALEPVRLAAADSAARLAAAERDDRSARAALLQAETASADAERALVAERARDTERETARAERLRQDAMGPRVEAHRSRLVRLREAATALDKSVAAETSARDASLAAEGAETAARAVLDDVRRAQAELPAAQARFDALDRASKLRGELSAKRLQLGVLERRVAAAAAALETARATLERTRGDLLQREAAWREGQAARLATTLAAGAPCPVCGSIHHPAPASGSAGSVDDAALAEARAAVDTAEQAWTQAQDAHAAALTSREALARDVARDADAFARGVGPEVDDLDEAVLEARSTVDSLAALVAAAETSAASLHGHSQRLASARAELDAASQQLTAQRSRYAAAAADAATASAELPEAWRDLDPAALTAAADRAKAAATARLAALDEALETADRVARERAAERAAAESVARQCAAALENARGEADRAALAWREAATDAGFADPEAALAARRTADAIARIEQTIARIERTRAAAADRLARAEAAAQGVPAPDLQALRETAEAATAAVEAAIQEQVRTDERSVKLASLRARLVALGEDLRRDEERYRVVGGLADVADGKGKDVDQRINFQRFVLAALLDEMLEAATHRLRAMSRGRYVLQRKREGESRNRAAGLDLEVADAWTGRVRAATSLSGGESFMAALSLALGLADVVQRRSGGRRIDALFVDEGFGTLDPEALDLALQALIDLRADGRLVGIISHVPELKERIDVRLEVTRGENGSTARLVLP